MSRRNHGAKGHDCPGLRICGGHPRWHVVSISVQGRTTWYAQPPKSIYFAERRISQPDAFAHAYSEARAEHLAADAATTHPSQSQADR